MMQNWKAFFTNNPDAKPSKTIDFTLTEDAKPFICQLTHLGLIKVAGLDAEKFLQGQFSCHMQLVTIDQSQLGCYCDQKGRILANFIIKKYDDAYIISLPHSLIKLFLIELKKYAVFSKVKCNDISNEYLQFGTKDKTNINTSDNNPLPQQENVILSKHGESIKPTMTLNYDKKNSRNIVIYPNNILDISSSIYNEELWHWLDISAGLAWISPETTGKFTPHQIDAANKNWVHLQKGCYRGQEIIARMHFLGKLKQHMHQVLFESDVKPVLGTDIKSTTDTTIGQWLNIIEEQPHHYRGLCVLNDKSIEEFTGKIIKL